MASHKKIVITCALTGSADTVGRNPAVPVTPEQIAKSAADAATAGAAVVHIHVRDPETGLASTDLGLYRETCDRIRASGTGVLLNLTTGPGQRFAPGKHDPKVAGPGTTLTTPRIRVEHVLELKPEICSLDIGTMCYGSAHADGDLVMINTPGSLREMATLIRDAGTKPELEVFDSGQVLLANHLIETGFIDRPPFFQLCLGMKWGAPSSREALGYLHSLLPKDAVWAAFGIGADQFPILAETLLAGGHVRVGLEDNLYLSRGQLAPSNAALVDRAVEIIERLGGSVATPGEAREVLALRASARV